MKRQCFYFQKGSVVQQVLGADLPVHLGGVGQRPGFGPLPPARSSPSPSGPGARTALQCRVPAPSTVLPGHWGWRRQESNTGSSLSLLVSTSHPAFLSTASSANLWWLQTQCQMQKQPLLINFSISSHNCARSKTYNKSIIPNHHSGSAFLTDMASIKSFLFRIHTWLQIFSLCMAFFLSLKFMIVSNAIVLIY